MHPYAYFILGVGIGLLALAFIYPIPESGLLFASSASASAEATVLFGGDLFFDRTVRSVMDEKGGDFLFSCIDVLLRKPDLAVANLEGPITDNPSVSEGSIVGAPENYQFTFAPEVAGLLRAHHIGLVNLGNNHITNFGYGGVASTEAYLDAAGVSYFGEPATYSVAYRAISGVKIAFIGYNEFGGSASTTLFQIATARGQGYLPVVYAHWGVEYESVAPLYIQTLARQFVDAGAALVIGSHPHVVEEKELYNDAYIYYSLGNFIFDQYFSDAVRNGLVVEAVFSKDRVVSVQEIPVYLGSDRRTCII